MIKKQVKMSRAINFVSEFMIISNKKEAYSLRNEAYSPEKEARSHKEKACSPRKKAYSLQKETCLTNKEICLTEKKVYSLHDVFRLVKTNIKRACGRFFRANTPFPRANTPHILANTSHSCADILYFYLNHFLFLPHATFSGTKTSHINLNMQETYVI